LLWFAIDDLLPLRFLQGDPPLNTRDVALKEISCHLSSDNLSQWNRTIGRLLDTGLSELGLHFSLQRASTLSKLLNDLTRGSGDLTSSLISGEVEDQVNEFVQNLSSIIWKLRYEHFHLFILSLCSLPLRSPLSSTSYSSSSSCSSLYPIQLSPQVIQMILTRFLKISPPDAMKSDSAEAMKKKLTTKPKTIIKKLGTGEGAGGGESEQTIGDPSHSSVQSGKPSSSSSLAVTGAAGGAGQSMQLMESVLDFNSLFLLLSSSSLLSSPESQLTVAIRESFVSLAALREFSVHLLSSLEYSEKILTEVSPILFRHCSSRLGESLPVAEILTNCLHLLLLHTNSTPHRHAHKKRDWDLLFRKIFNFQNTQSSLALDSKLWMSHWTESFLQIDHTQLSPPTWRDLYANRFEAFQALSALLSQTQTQIETGENSSSVPIQEEGRREGALSVELFFRTHIFLFSEEVLQIITQPPPLSGFESESHQLALPFSLACFSSTVSLCQLFHQIENHLKLKLTPIGNHKEEEEDREKVTRRGVVMLLTHLLRIWGGGSRLLPRDQKMQSLFEFWASATVATAPADGVMDQTVQVYLPCFLKILELCSQHPQHLHEEFLDVLLLDVLTPSLALVLDNSPLSEMLQLHISTILQLSQRFGEEYSAWVGFALSLTPFLTSL
jgi:hypothetical protein